MKFLTGTEMGLYKIPRKTLQDLISLSHAPDIHRSDAIYRAFHLGMLEERRDPKRASPTIE